MTQEQRNELIIFIKNSIRDTKIEYVKPSVVFMNYHDFDELLKVEGLISCGSIREGDDRPKIFGLPINRNDCDTCVAFIPETKRFSS